MSAHDREAYRKAFVEYLRRGTPIRLSRKQIRETAQYVWHTAQDEKVRQTHRANDGHLFSWDEPPPTGHPGQDYNCRCAARPYVQGETEFGYHELAELEPSSTYRWGDADLVAHYYQGGGVDVTLAEIGHLAEMVEQYAYKDGDLGAFRRLSNQLANEARQVHTGQMTYEFEFAYDFGNVEFSHGFGVVAGSFMGSVVEIGAIPRIDGESNFNFSDRFEDPIGLGIEVGGDPYGITGRWSATFTAEVFSNARESDFR